MKYEQLELDFISRTLKLIDEYEKSMVGKDEKDCFDVTVYINSLLGLIVLPKETGLLNYLPKERIETVGFSPESQFNEEIKTTKDLVTQLRHSVAHFDIEFKANEKDKIDRVVFKDEKTQEGKIIANIQVNDLKIFVRLIAEIMVESYKKQEKINENRVSQN